jgi:hypothetical protein
MRVAIFGDVSGHLDPFLGGLATVGVVPGSPWPGDLAVVQVGDLVHKGPDSSEVVALVAALAAFAPPGRWVQLAGNHEAVHVGGVRFGVDGVGPATAATLAGWHACGFLAAAVAVDTPRGSWLVSHAGVTRRWWEDRLGGERSAAACAAALNGLLASRPDAFSAGVMLGGPRADASPLWAHPTAELWPGWAAHPDPPFSQAHGHASAFWWARGRWSTPPPPPDLAAAAAVDRRARRVTLPLAGGTRIVGVDPGYGRYAARPLLPLVLGDATVVDPPRPPS